MTSTPPPTGPCCGVVAATADASRYSKWMPLSLKSWPLEVTSTVALPGASGRDTHSMYEGDCHVAGALAPSPKRHASPGPRAKPSPVTTTRVPPRSGPTTGATLETSHPPTTESSSYSADSLCRLFVTATTCTPTSRTGPNSQIISLELSHVWYSATLSSSRQVPPGIRLRPVTRRRIALLAAMELGTTLVIVSKFWKRKLLPSVEKSTPLLVTSSGAMPTSFRSVQHVSTPAETYSARMTKLPILQARGSPSTNPSPVTTTEVPPRRGPFAGETYSTVGSSS